MKTLIASLALLSSAGLLACNANQAAKPTPPAGQTQDRSAPAAKETPTIEDFLRWPLEGRSGTDRLIAALHRTFEMKRIRDAQYSGDGPLKLIDGHTLSFADTLEKSPFIDIGIDEAKCVDPQWAAGLIGAELSPVHQDAHGVDRGRSYHASRNGMFLRFNTTPVTYRCVTDIHVSPEPRARP